MMPVRVGSRSSRQSRRSDVGRGSNEQEVGFDFKIVLSGPFQLSGGTNENWSQNCWSVSLQLVSDNDC